MPKKRRIITYIATSADGYIARSDGDVSWLDRPRVAGDYGYQAFIRSIDTVLWGRKTYDFAVKHGGVGMFGKRMKHFVFSSHLPESTTNGVEFVNEPVSGFCQRLRALAGENIWMMGGATVIGAFLDAGEIDEFLVHVIPVFIGEGIPLVAPRHREIPLKLLSVRKYPDGVVALHYAVEREGTGKPRQHTAR